VKDLEGQGYRAAAFPADLGDPQAVKQVVAKARAALGPITTIAWTAYSNGAGDLRFTRGESDEVLDSKVNLQPGTIARIRQLFELSDFLGSETAIQDKRDMSHLGWITIGAKQGSRERKVRYNFTTNPHIKELQDIFLGIAWQEIALFDIDNAVTNWPVAIS